MSDALIVGILSATISLIGIFISYLATRNAVSQRLDIQQNVLNNEVAHIKAEIQEMKHDIQSHNQYARMFSENIPAIKERLNGLDKRLEQLEK